MVAWLGNQGLSHIWLTTEPGTRAERFMRQLAGAVRARLLTVKRDWSLCGQMARARTKVGLSPHDHLNPSLRNRIAHSPRVHHRPATKTRNGGILFSRSRAAREESAAACVPFDLVRRRRRRLSVCLVSEWPTNFGARSTDFDWRWDRVVREGREGCCGSPGGGGVSSDWRAFHSSRSRTRPFRLADRRALCCSADPAPPGEKGCHCDCPRATGCAAARALEPR